MTFIRWVNLFRLGGQLESDFFFVPRERIQPAIRRPGRCPLLHEIPLFITHPVFLLRLSKTEVLILCIRHYLIFTINIVCQLQTSWVEKRKDGDWPAVQRKKTTRLTCDQLNHLCLQGCDLSRLNRSEISLHRESCLRMMGHDDGRYFREMPKGERQALIAAQVFIVIAICTTDFYWYHLKN